MERFTHLGRTIDLRYPSNRFAVVASAVVGIVTGLAASGDGRSRAAAGATAVVAAFLSWALGRELDPDRTTTANVACVAGGLAAGAFGGVGIGALYLLLATVRVTVGTTGRSPTAIDLAGHLILAVFVARTPAGWAAGIVFAFALARDLGLPDPAPPWQMGWSAATAVAVSVMAGVSGRGADWIAPSASDWILVAVGLAGAALLAPPEATRSTTDLTGAPLSPARLRWGRGLGSAVLVLAAVAAGGNGIRPLVAGWVTIAVAGAVRLWSPTNRG